ncbi:NAD(P)H-dependent oxidoreductase [Ochrobactrum sp. RH2CCR150]|uniref:FMN-dependent NADH-azoreductase n=1 Tax=Ochrobactrum sp. RH2CCR150 TaxID=2587044 RepID=UPI0015FBD66B|nr:FMN-dependent NADH-azoreductase [Ochrobactrum sp. RH2CCR150]
MKNILLITSSPNGEGALSTRFARDLADKLALKDGHDITSRDLAAEPLPHIGPAYVHGRMLSPEERTATEDKAIHLAETLVKELLEADIIIVGSSMINYAPSTQLKAWFDHVIWPGVTVKFSEHGPQGLLSNKKIYLVTTSGGAFSEGNLEQLDFQSRYVRHLFAVIGLNEVEHIRIEGTAFGPQAAQAAMDRARVQIDALVEAA